MNEVVPDEHVDYYAVMILTHVFVRACTVDDLAKLPPMHQSSWELTRHNEMPIRFKSILLRQLPRGL